MIARIASGVGLLALLSATAATADEVPRLAFERYTLENGLSVILHVDHWQPLVAVSVLYDVGAIDQEAGRTGFAHLFEHLMFQATAHIGVDEYMRYLESAGATDYNGRTSVDFTEYYETVPSHELELALWLESDRMGFLLQGLTQERLENQKRVVKNELIESMGDAPYGRVDQKISEMLYPAGHPLRDGVGGSVADIEAASLKEAQEFFRVYYTPANASLVLAGDFELDEAKALIRSYFGSIKGLAKPKRRETRPALINEDRVHLQEQVARRGRLTMIWPGPPAFSEEAADCEVFAYVLSQSRVTRVGMVNFKEKSIEALDASVIADGSSTIFRLDATVAPGLTFELAKIRVQSMLQSYRDDPPTEDEVFGAWNALELHTVDALQKIGGGSGRARQLNFLQHYFGDPGKTAWLIQRWRRATPYSVRKVVATRLSKPPLVIYAEAASRP
jgi:zinc protease